MSKIINLYEMLETKASSHKLYQAIHFFGGGGGTGESTDLSENLL